jgi:flagellar basal-body rod protein FlgB
METAPVEAWFNQLQRAMDVLDAQHRVIASNIANVNTPAFQRSALDFKGEMSRLLNEGIAAGGPGLRATAAGMISEPEDREDVAPQVDESSPARPDGNNVNLEREMVDLSETGEVYSTLSRVAVKNLRMMRYVISGGRG